MLYYRFITTSYYNNKSTINNQQSTNNQTYGILILISQLSRRRGRGLKGSSTINSTPFRDECPE